MPVRLNLFSEIRLLTKLAKTKEKSKNIVQHFGIIYSPGNNLKIIEELMEVTFIDETDSISILRVGHYWMLLKPTDVNISKIQN